MQRRVFVKSGALALVTLGLSPSFLRRTVFASSLPAARKGKVLVCLFQRGAADALNVVVPHGEQAYYALRPNIAIPRPRASDTGTAVDLDGFFGLHPSLSPLARYYRDGIMAPVHAVGSPSATRSHFDAQDYLESGTPDLKSTRAGWLNRYLAVSGTCEACSASPFRAVAMTAQTPRILDGPAPAVVISSLGAFSVRAPDASADRLEAMYRTGTTDLVHASGKEMFDAVRMLKSANPLKYGAANGADYPRSQFGQRLKDIAQLIKSDVGMELAFADVGGWDTHVNQGGASGQLAGRLRDFADSIDAFVTDLGDRMDDVLVMTMSEFGRMARQNGTGGTDHGHAGSMFLLGGGVRGGKVHGRWPGLEREQLYEGRDLALTTDFRTVFSEVLTTHLGAGDLSQVFPGFAAIPRAGLGLLR
ncbi:MAG: DUF1501 domain-containing protein [Gemmatimonadaceae bacterium]